MPPQNVDSLCNFLSGNSSKDLAARIDFKRLDDIEVTTVGVFGDQQEIVNQLRLFGVSESITRALHAGDGSENAFPCGVHMILPFDIASKQFGSTCQVEMIVFFWPQKDTFKPSQISRRNIACMFTKLMVQLSHVLVVPISGTEV